MTLKGKLKAAAIFLLAAALLFGAFFVSGKTVLKLLYPMKYSDYVEKYSEEFGVDRNLLFAVIKTESSFNPNAVSHAHAEGLTQITPETLEWLQMKLGEEDEAVDLFDPETSVK